MKSLSAFLFSLSMIVCGATYAATQQDAEAALAAATQLEMDAGKLGNRWVPAETLLKTAQAAFAAKDWDKAIASAHEVQALAERAIAQSKEQETAWHDAVIK